MVEESLAFGGMAARERDRSRGDTFVNNACNRCAVVGRDQRPEFAPRIEAGTQRESPCQFADAAEELLLDRALHQEPRARDAHLPGVTENALHHTDGGGVEVGIRENDRGRLAAELEGQFLEVACGRVHDPPAGLRRTRERNLVDVGMRGKRLANNSTGASNDIDDACGHACLDQ